MHDALDLNEAFDAWFLFNPWAFYAVQIIGLLWVASWWIPEITGWWTQRKDGE